MNYSRVGGGDTDANAGKATFFGRVDDAEWDNSIVSGMDSEEHRPAVVRRCLKKCEDCQQTWGTLYENGVLHRV